MLTEPKGAASASAPSLADSVKVRVMAALFILIAIGAAIACAGSGLVGIAVINAIASVWSNGVLLNFKDDPQSAPNWAATVSMLTTLLAIGLGIAGLVSR